MKNTAKLIVAGVFALGALFGFLSSDRFSRTGAAVFSHAAASPTPPQNTNTSTSSNVTNKLAVNSASSPAPVAANTVSNTATASTSTGSKKITKNFTLGQNSMTEHGDVAFNHENHAYKKYSADGKSVVGCVECHHTDQPAKAMKAPLVTSERDEILTDAVYQKSSQKVSTCRSCHFQDGEVLDGKTMPVLGDSDLNNQVAYHQNCNVCHDAAARLRPAVKKTAGFATTSDCTTCHKENK